MGETPRPVGGVASGKINGRCSLCGWGYLFEKMRLWPHRVGLQLPVRRFLCDIPTHHRAVGPQNEFGGLLHARQSSNEAGSGRTYSVVIAGGGIMGCSSAYFLAQRIPPSSICVVERDSKVYGGVVW